MSSIVFLMRVRFATGRVDDAARIGVSLADRSATARENQVELSWVYADHATNDAQSRDRTVDREVAMLFAARARAEATEANRAGEYDRARRVLERTATRIRGYTYGDAELKALARALLVDVERFAERPMSAMELKSAFFVAESTGMGRSAEGKARRSRPTSH